MDAIKIEKKIKELITYKENLVGKPSISYKMYHKFMIPKKSGGNREILAPNGNLKAIQYKLLFTLKSIFDYYHIKSPYAYGMIGVKENALQHKDSSYFLTMDISKFYPSLKVYRVQEKLWKKLNEVQKLNFAFTAKKFDEIITYSAYNSSLATGSPATPLLAELYMLDFDTKVVELLKKMVGEDAIYTRYVDDITISSKTPIQPKVITEVKNLLYAECLLKVNKKKTKLYSKTNNRVRKDITGVTISKEKNITLGRSYIESLKKEIYEYAKDSHGCPRHLITPWKFELKDFQSFLLFITKEVKTKSNILIWKKRTQKVLGKITYLKFVYPEGYNNLCKKYGTDIEKLFIGYLRIINKRLKKLGWKDCQNYRTKITKHGTLKLNPHK